VPCLVVPRSGLVVIARTGRSDIARCRGSATLGGRGVRLGWSLGECTSGGRLGNPCGGGYSRPFVPRRLVWGNAGVMRGMVRRRQSDKAFGTRTPRVSERYSQQELSGPVASIVGRACW
jgi:hypothetical protein